MRLIEKMILTDRQHERELMEEGRREALLQEDLNEAKEIAMGKSDVKPVARHFEALLREHARLVRR